MLYFEVTAGGKHSTIQVSILKFNLSCQNLSVLTFYHKWKAPTFAESFDMKPITSVIRKVLAGFMHFGNILTTWASIWRIALLNNCSTRHFQVIIFKLVENIEIKPSASLTNVLNKPSHLGSIFEKPTGRFLSFGEWLDRSSGTVLERAGPDVRTSESGGTAAAIWTDGWGNGKAGIQWGSFRNAGALIVLQESLGEWANLWKSGQ